MMKHPNEESQRFHSSTSDRDVPQIGCSNGDLMEHHPEDDNGDDDEEDDEYKELITLPESTHSLFFTEPILSLPFVFAFVIAAMSFLCLGLATTNNLTDSTENNRLNVPANVEGSVRVAQYMAILIGILMEEEIPTGLYLLRSISQHSLKTKFPIMKYWKFILSSLCRIFLGYFFLINMFLIVVQAERVLDIFYDVLALQFIQQLDDIAFNLAKWDVLGKKMKRAATQKCFRAEFQKETFGRFKSMGILLKGIYFANLFLSLFGLSTIASFQAAGKYQCNSITVTFGDDIWEEALVQTSSSGEYEKMVLLYSYFNGIYSRKEGVTEDGRPIYVEQRKFDGSEPFENKVGAEIKYCKKEKAWIFTHESIRKSTTVEEDECPWLLKSPETDFFDLLGLDPGGWSIWTGVVVNGAEISTVCNECSASSDCNYNGICVKEQCVCDETSGVYGKHCGHKKPCQTIQDMTNNSTWSIVPWYGNADITQYYQYNRPVYAFNGGSSDIIIPTNDVHLMFSGSRWFGIQTPPIEELISKSLDDLLDVAYNYHAFWDEAYTASGTFFVSDPTTDEMKSDPVGIDFYLIGKRGKEHGPFGVLHPLQEPPGHVLFRCLDPVY